MRPTIVLLEKPTQYKPLAARGTTVHFSINGNVNYATPLPTLISIQTGISDLQAAIGKWGDVHDRGSHADLLDLRAKAKALYLLLKAEQSYVINTALIAAGNDDILLTTILESSGFDLKNAKHPQGVLQMVQNFREFISRKLNSNQKELQWKKPLGVKQGSKIVYLVYMADTNNFSTAVNIATVDKTKYRYTNTTTASVTKTFWIIPHGSTGDGVRSEGITLTVQGV